MGGRPERFINSLSFQYLTQSIELDLSNIHGRGMFPSKKEINSFIMEEMGIGPGVLRGVQHHPRFPKVHLQFLKDEDMQVAELKVKDGLVMQCKKLKIYGYRCDQPMVTIVLNGQDMDIEDGEIKRVLEKYGTVVTCERGKNIDLSTSDHFVTDGTWTIRMTPKLRVQTPETIYYFGPSGAIQTWVLNYDGVGSSCILCGIQGHMGFRCNSLIPRGGRLGKQPAGVGFWTDVVKCLKPAVQQPVMQGQGPPAAQPGAPPGVAPEGLAGAPALPVAAAPLNDRNTLFAKAKQQGVGFSASQPVWGSGPPRVEPRASVAPAIPGMPNQELKWQRKRLKNQRRNEKKKEKRKVEGVPIHNPYDALKDDDEGDEWDTDDDEEVAKEKPVQESVRVGRRSSVLEAYGARRGVSLVNWFKKTTNKTIEKPTNSKKVERKSREPKILGKKRRGSFNAVDMELKKTRQSPAVDPTQEEAEADAKQNENDIERQMRGNELATKADELPKVVPNNMENEKDVEGQTGGDKLVDKADDLPDVEPEPNDDEDSDDKVSVIELELSLSVEANASSLPASEESVNLLAEQGGEASTLPTQVTRDEYGQGMSDSEPGMSPTMPTQGTRAEESQGMPGSETSMPSSVTSANLLVPTQPTQDNRAGYAQSLGTSEPSVLLGSGDSGVNTDLTFFVGSQGKPSQHIVSEEALEIKQRVERIKSQIENEETDEMSSSSGYQNDL